MAVAHVVEHHTNDGRVVVTEHASKKAAKAAGQAIRDKGGSAFVHEKGFYNRFIKGPAKPGVNAKTGKATGAKGGKAGAGTSTGGGG